MRRPWQGWDDLLAMQGLLGRAMRDRPSTSFIHPGDLAWWLGWPPKDHLEIAGWTVLWERDGVVGAWVTLDGTDVGECVEPPDEGLRLEVDRWLADRSAVTRFVRHDDTLGIARLTGAGYRRVNDDMLAFRMPLPDDTPPDPRVRPVQVEDDVPPRAAITRAAFGVDRPFDRYVDQYRTFMASPAYPADWDLVAWAPSGEAAACAIAWPDEISRVVNFEPVATHPAYRRQGFASAVLREGCRRLRRAGMTTAIVRTPADNDAAIALYRSVGFAVDHEQLAFRWS